ncbi:RNA polymerase sigma-70 factor (TIGR02957 family) [Streptomyces africanus]|uniref:RNA polymerase sigma-70 factor (TIGR02957 family) n=1 Tax=Streptomyces africanus TaxID=231024 RepID=A0ABU0QHY8_9ACTN|nr:RNA polymerase sigma-70 factor [Streptomyces africanus]MDQ0746991.1 RNA polymerase sigma-70 factor (TIGR02957 family) [Streptomyces africanus]
MSERGERTTGGAGPLDRTGRTEPADSATEVFVAHRDLLFTVAYEMLGSAADAEDVLQETWLRWVGVDPATVREKRAYLVRIVTRQALDRMRALGRRKESYVGPWLPEPLLTAPDVAEDVELADSISMAMLLVLETLAPVERAVFVLREVFALEYDEIAEAVGRSPAAVRQLAYRARAHVAARRPRGTVSPAQTRAALQAFQRAVETGELQGLLDILAPDVVALSDGGGVAHALLRPVVGADEVARLLAAGWWRRDAERSVEPAQINGAPGLLVRVDGEVDGVVAVRVENGCITGAYHVRNPEKLSRVARETAVRR